MWGHITGSSHELGALFMLEWVIGQCYITVSEKQATSKLRKNLRKPEELLLKKVSLWKKNVKKCCCSTVLHKRTFSWFKWFCQSLSHVPAHIHWFWNVVFWQSQTIYLHYHRGISEHSSTWKTGIFLIILSCCWVLSWTVNVVTNDIKQELSILYFFRGTLSPSGTSSISFWKDTTTVMLTYDRNTKCILVKQRCSMKHAKCL